MEEKQVKIRIEETGTYSYSLLKDTSKRVMGKTKY